MLLTDFLDCAWRQLWSNPFTTSTLSIAVTCSEPQTKCLLALQAISLWHSDTFRVDASSQVKYTVNTLCFLKNSLSLHSRYKYKFIFSLFPAIKVYSNKRWRANSVSAYLEELWSSGKVSLTCMSSVRLCTRALNKELRPSFSYRSSLVYWKIHVQHHRKLISTINTSHYI